MSSVSQADIDEKLANAQANGYWLDDTLNTVTVDFITRDLIDYDVDCEEIEFDRLKPFVQDWYDRHNPEVCR